MGLFNQFVRSLLYTMEKNQYIAWRKVTLKDDAIDIYPLEYGEDLN